MAFSHHVRIPLIALSLLACLLSAGADGKHVLVFSLTRGFRHKDAIAKGNPILAQIARSLGYDCTVSEDPAVFDPDKIAKWDVIVFNNCTGRMLLTRPERRQALMRRIHDEGAGFMGFHAATDCFYDWPEYGRMLNGYFNGHPWNQVCDTLLEEPDHPLLKAFDGKPFRIKDEIYQFRNYDRSAVRVLMSIDPTSVDVTRGRRADRDYAICWIRQWGKGRVFYNAHGHYGFVFQDKTFQEHIRTAMQWCAGDLDAPAAPRGGTEDLERQAQAAFERLRTARTPEERVAALHALAWRPALKALDLVVAEFERDQKTASEAAAAAEAICAYSKDLPAERKIEILKRALPLARNPNTRKAIVRQLSALGVDDIPIPTPPGFIAKWWAAGPIPDPDGKLFERVCAPENGVDLEAGFTVDGKRYRWKRVLADERGIVDLNQAFGRRDNAGAYLYARVHLDAPVKAGIRLGSDDGFVLWVNGKRLGGKNVHRALQPGADQFQIPLRAGDNEILLKVLQGAGLWQACVQLVGPDGAPLPVRGR